MPGNAPDNAVYPSPRWEPIDDKLLHEVWASDQVMYPAPELTYERLKSLSDACPELSICLRGTQPGGDDGTGAHERAAPAGDASRPESAVGHHGLIIVWPLPAATYWDQLLDHTIKEHDVKATMFPSGCGNNSGGEKTPVGLHVFHIERFPAFQKTRGGAGFTRLALQEIRQRVAKLGRARSWDVVGYSALVATPDGASVFTQLGFHPTGTTEEANDQDSFSPRMLKLDGNEPFLPLS